MDKTIGEGLESIRIISTPLLGAGVAITCSINTASEYFAAPWLKDISARGFVTSKTLATAGYGDCTLICFDNDTFNIGVIAHESVHAARRIMAKVGIPNNNSTEEVQAYLVEWLTDTIIEYFNESGWTDKLCAEDD